MRIQTGSKPSVRATTVLRRLLGLKQTRVVGFTFDQDRLVIDVRPTTREPRCSGCARAKPAYDQRERCWRHLDFCGLPVVVRYSMRRVDCAECGVRSELVPWAEHGSGFTRPFEELCAFLAQRTDQTTVSRLLGIAWETVGRIAQRVVRRLGPQDRLQGLEHIGVDELSYRRHHHYITVVTDQVSGTVVWACEGRTTEAFKSFFEALGPERTSRIKTVTLDMLGAYIEAVRRCAPRAKLVFDRFHVQRLVHDALDQVRRQQVRAVKADNDPLAAAAIKRTRFALQKNPWNLTQIESARLVAVQTTNRPLYRGYLLKETLAAILDLRGVHTARAKLTEWIGWAARSRLAPFRRVARTIASHAEGILEYVRTGLSNGRAEGLNGKIRTITRRAFGLHSASSLIGHVLLCCSGLRIDPPRRTARGFL